jgi:hypothetical protein
MATDLIRYDLLVQEALRGVVRRVLEDTMREGLPGEHHYYVTFRTNAPGVRLSQRMRERYPDEMTIILQHQFWDLTVNDHAFEVGLSFSGTPERLSVPFESLTGFFDPSVQFGLKFEVQEAAIEKGANDSSAPPPATAEPPSVAKLPTGRSASPAREAKPPLRGAGSEPAEVPPGVQRPEPQSSPRPTADAAKSQPPAGAAKPADDTGPKVVSIDAFRKKP